MATSAPGAGPDLVRDAHYHAIAASKTWAAFVAQMTAEATATADERARADEQRKRETTYARGILGRH